MNSFSEIVAYNSFTYLFVLTLSVITYRKYKGSKVFKYKKDKIFSYTFGFFVLSFMATVFAGPCALFRYALPYIVLIPTLMACVFNVNIKRTN